MVARGRSEVVKYLPGGCIDAVGVLLEGGQGSWGVEVPQLDGVIPAARQEGVPPHNIPVHAVYLHRIPELLRNVIEVGLAWLHKVKARAGKDG